MLVAGAHFTGIFFYEVAAPLVAPLQHIHYQGLISTGSLREYTVLHSLLFPHSIGTKCRFEPTLEKETAHTRRVMLSGNILLLIAPVFLLLSTYDGLIARERRTLV